jgi:NADP-dependent 3-hydroxy acid dehydrogenase YdfG
LRALHAVLREELRGSGVRTTLVSPGPTDTALWDVVQGSPQTRLVARDRMLQAGAVADAILFAVTRPVDVNVDELRLSPA